MKLFIFLLLISTSTWAQNPKYLSDSTQVITQKQRALDSSSWKPILEGRIEIIKDSQVKDRNKEFADKLNDQILDQLETLQMGEIYLAHNKISYDDHYINYPFVMSVRYKENLLSQGTLNVEGTLQIEVRGSEVVAIELIYFSNSQWLEEQGRSFGFLDSYGAEFLETICSPFLFKVFSEQKYLNKLSKSLRLKLATDSILRKVYFF